MNIFKKLKALGDVEIPLTVVVIAIAITVVMLHQPQKEVYYVLMELKSQQIHSV